MIKIPPAPIGLMPFYACFHLFETLPKQSPIYLENDEEYETIFENANSTLHAFGYALREEKVMTIILIDSFLLFSIILGQK